MPGKEGSVVHGGEEWVRGHVPGGKYLLRTFRSDMVAVVVVVVVVVCGLDGAGGCWDGG